MDDNELENLPGGSKYQAEQFQYPLSALQAKLGKMLGDVQK